MSAVEYNRINWKNGTIGATPISAENLNIMDKGIEDSKKAINETSGSTTKFASYDVADSSATAWTPVDTLKTGETHASMLSKISKMFKNIRFLNKKYTEINDNLTNKVISKKYKKNYTISGNNALVISFDVSTPEGYTPLVGICTDVGSQNCYACISTTSTVKLKNATSVSVSDIVSLTVLYTK